MLDTLGDQVNLPEDNIGGYVPHVTCVPPFLSEVTPTPEETKEKELYPKLHPIPLQVLMETQLM